MVRIEGRDHLPSLGPIDSKEKTVFNTKFDVPNNWKTTSTGLTPEAALEIGRKVDRQAGEDAVQLFRMLVLEMMAGGPSGKDHTHAMLGLMVKMRNPANPDTDGPDGVYLMLVTYKVTILVAETGLGEFERLWWALLMALATGVPGMKKEAQS